MCAVLAMTAQVSADDTTELRTVTLEYDEVILGGEYLNETVDWKPKSWLKITGDALASLGEHHVDVPLRWSTTYNPELVQPSSWVTILIKGYTDDEPTHVLQTLSAGFTLTLAIAFKTFFGWNELGWGLDLGIDIVDLGKAPMAGESSVGSDTMQTGIWIPPGPPGYVPTLAEVVLQLGSKLQEGSIWATLSVTNGTLYDCDNLLHTSMDLEWTSDETVHCIRVQVDPTVGDGDFLDIQLADLSYTAETAVPVGLQAKIVGAGAPVVPLGEIPAADLSADTTDAIHFEIPVKGTPADLIAGHILLSNDPNRLWPENEYQVYGYVINNSTVVDLAVSSTAELAIRPAAGGPWEILESADIAPLAHSKSVYVQATLSAPDYEPGDYELRLAVDVGDSFVEANELNNEAGTLITILPIPPDLSPVNDTLTASPSQPSVDEAFEISIDVTNHARATLPATGFEVAFEVYDNSSSSWLALGSTTITSLAPGATTTATASVPAPSPGEELAPGSYVVRATVDSAGAIAELRESNNHTYDGLQLADTGPDLHALVTDLYFMSTPDPPLPSTSTIVWLNVRNGGGTEAQDVAVDFYKVKGTTESPVRIPIASELIPWVAPGASSETAISFVPQEIDSVEPGGEWIIEAAIGALDGEANVANNVVQRSLYIGAPVGELEVRVKDASTDALLDGAVVSLSPSGLQTTSQAAAIGEAHNPFVNARIVSVPQGTQSLTVSKTGYVAFTGDVVFYGGQPSFLHVALETDPDPDLTGEVSTEPPEPPPGSWVDFKIRLINIGTGDVLEFSGIIVAIYLNGDRIGQAVIDDPIPAGGSVEVTLPGGPYMLAPVGDSHVDLVVDEGNSVVEVSEGNNTDHDIVTNPKPVLVIDSIAPNPADFGQAVTLSGSASDASGQVLEVEWWSDRDGLVATGAVATVSDLSVGVHALRLRAADEHDEWVEVTQVGVTIRDSLAPVPRLLYGAGDTLIAPAAPLFVWVADDDTTPQDQLEYAYYLEGVDGDYSAWATDRDALYTNVATGSYTFWIKARDQAGNESAPALSVAFEVVDPPVITPDAGPIADASTTVIDAGPLPDSATGAGDGDGGCGCRSSEPSATIWSLLLLAVAFAARREREKNRVQKQRGVH